MRVKRSKLYWIRYHRRYYAENKEALDKRNRAYYSKNKSRLNRKASLAADQKRKFLRKAKQRPCVDCRRKYPHYVMEFDHVRGRKKNAVSHMCGMSWASLKRELDKCDVVCANCHRKRTYRRGQLTRTRKY